MNNIDDVDQRLRDYALRWRASQPPPRSVEAAVFSRPASARPKRWIAVLAMACAIVLVAAGVGAVAGKRTDQPIPAQSSSRPNPTASDVIAWAALSPTGVQIPTISAPETPDPSRAAALPLCRAAQLKVSSEIVGTMGTENLMVTITSATPCHLVGYPSAAALDPSGRTLAVPTVHQITALGYYSGPAVVSDSTPAVFTIQWSLRWCAVVPIDVAKVRITLPAGSGTFTVPGFGRPVCTDPPYLSSPPPLEIGPIQPRDYFPARDATEFNDVEVSLAVPHVVVSPGETLRFTVNLRAPALHAVPLNPCPDYTIWLKSLSATRASYALNCAAVSYRDAAGYPLLPPGSTVAFAMQVLVPSTIGATPGTPLVLGWNLNTVEETGSTTSLTVG